MEDGHSPSGEEGDGGMGPPGPLAWGHRRMGALCGGGGDGASAGGGGWMWTHQHVSWSEAPYMGYTEEDRVHEGRGAREAGGVAPPRPSPGVAGVPESDPSLPPSLSSLSPPLSCSPSPALPGKGTRHRTCLPPSPDTHTQAYTPLNTHTHTHQPLLVS